MANSSQAGWDVVLPSLAAPVGKLMEDKIGYDRQDKRYEQQLEMQRQRMDADNQQAQQRENERKLKFVQDNADPSKYMTGIEKIDALTQKMSEQVYLDHVALASTMPMDKLMMSLKQNFTPIAVGATAIKNKYNDELGKLQTYATKNKSFNLGAAKSDLLSSVGNMFVAQTPDGVTKFKALDEINPEEDLAAGMLDPNNRWKYSVGSGVLKNSIANEKGDPRNYFVKGGDGSIANYEGFLPSWAEETAKPNAQGYVSGTPSFKIKADEINSLDSKGNPVKIKYMKPEEMNNILNTDEKIDEFNRMWNEKKAASPDLQNHSAQDEEVLKGAFMYDFIKANDKNQPRPKTIQHLPRNTTNNYIGGGGGGANSGMKDVYKEVSQVVANDVAVGNPKTKLNTLSATTQKAILDIARGLDAGKVIDPKTGATIPLDNEDIHLENRGGRIMIIRGGDVITPLDFYDVNIKANQTLGAKAKQQVLSSKAAKNEAPKAAKGNSGINWKTN